MHEEPRAERFKDLQNPIKLDSRLADLQIHDEADPHAGRKGEIGLPKPEAAPKRSDRRAQLSRRADGEQCFCQIRTNFPIGEL